VTAECVKLGVCETRSNDPEFDTEKAAYPSSSKSVDVGAGESERQGENVKVNTTLDICRGRHELLAYGARLTDAVSEGLE